MTKIRRVSYMELRQIKGNTYCIDTGTTYIPFYKINSEEIILLDSGRAKLEREGIDELIEINNLKVAGIICSHAHIDHIGNNKYFKKKYKCIIAMPTYEALVCSSITNLKVFYTRYTLTDVTKRFEHMVCKTDIMIFSKQESIDVCGVEFKIFNTPGHSPEHISIITPDDVAYVGDALISHEVMKRAKIPYTFLLKEDLRSKMKLYDLKCSKYVVAHKGVYDDIRKLIADNIEHYKGRAAKAYDVIDGRMTMEEITKSVIKSFNIHVKSINRYFLIERMLKAHIEYLNEIGMIELIMEDGFLKYKKSI
jgi:hydroxyacylglutathione hydrolase